MTDVVIHGSDANPELVLRDEVNTSVDYEHQKGRTYLVTVDKHHRPAQLPRGMVVCRDFGEVNLSNKNDFWLRYIPKDLEARICGLFPEELSDNMTFNEMLEAIVSGVEQERRLAHIPTP